MKKWFPILTIVLHIAGCLLYADLCYSRAEHIFVWAYTDALSILICGTLVFCLHYGLLFAFPEKIWKKPHLTILWTIEIILLYIPMVMMFGFVFFGVEYRYFSLDEGIVYLQYIMPMYIIPLLARIVSSVIIFCKTRKG